MSFEGVAIASAGLVLASGGTAGVVLTQGMVPPPTGSAPGLPSQASATWPGASLPAPASPARVRETAAPVRAGGARVSVTALSGAPTGRSSGIPARASEAYQVAAVVMDSADRACRLDWQLLAAIGSVESDHGRTGGSRLATTGVATPEIVGPALDGAGDLSEVRDTDGGGLDGDGRFDRAVGPMQFLPSTWWAVAVDGDDDGTRDPQDLDDAALAAAVYLCWGDEDLGTAEGRREAVYRYNHSDSYVDHVLAVRKDYLAAVPPGAVGADLVALGTTSAAVRPGTSSTGDPGSPAAGSSTGGEDGPRSGSSGASSSPQEPREHDGSGHQPPEDGPRPEPEQDEVDRTLEETEERARDQAGLPPTDTSDDTSPAGPTTGSTP